MNLHRLLSQISIGAKLRLLGVVSTVLLLLTAANLLWSEYQINRRNHQQALQEQVESVHALLGWAHGLEQSGSHTRAQAQQLALQMLAKARYGAEGYFVVQDLEGRIVMHPLRPELNGQSGATIKDADGQPFLQRISDTARQHGSGFVHYRWTRPGSNEPVARSAYVKAFAPWGWAVLSGVYMDALQTEFWTSVLGVSWLVALALVVNLLLGRSINRSIGQGVKKAMRVAQTISQRDLSLPITVKGKDEISQLLEAMRNNPRDWRIEQLQTLARQFGLAVPSEGGSHHVFSHEAVAEVLSVPAHRPIKPVYVRRFVALIDQVKESQA